MPDNESAEPVRLSRVSQVIVAVAAAVVAVAVAVHCGLVVLYLAPENVVSERYESTIHDYMSPELAQNWNLFAPEPPHANTAVHARTEVRRADGSTFRTGWTNLSAVDYAATRGNPIPSDTRDQLRKGWRRYVQTHDRRGVAMSESGLIAEAFLRRIAVARLVPAEGTVLRVQLRLATTPVPEPPWRGTSATPRTTHQTLPWWRVPEEEGAR